MSLTSAKCHSRGFRRESILFFLLLVSFAANAGGPISVSPSGVPAKWDVPIALDVEAGTCATFSNADMLSKLETDLDHWSSITGVTLSYTITQSICGDINVDNYTDYLVLTGSDPGFTDGLNPVMFDDDGNITEDLYGTANKYNVLGFAGPDSYADSSYLTISGGQAVFNCRCLAGNAEGDCPGNMVFTTDDLDFTMTHELGHMTGMDHSAVNEVDSGGCDTSVAGDCDNLPAMYPISEDPADQMTPTRDDEVSLLSLYGLSYVESHNCTVTGTLLDVDGNPLRCADVHAETDDPADTIGVVSGIFAPNQDLDGDGLTNGDGECLSNCGDFTLRGLDPSKNYTIVVHPLSSDWTDGSGIYPCDPQLTGINEEQIDSFSVGDCAAGDTRALGEISTTSTGGVSSNLSASGIGSRDLDSGLFLLSLASRHISSALALRAATCGTGSSSGSGASGCALRPSEVGAIHELPLPLIILFTPFFLLLLKGRFQRNDL